LLLANTKDKFSVLVSELRGFESSDSETEQEAIFLPQDALVIRPMNREDSTGLHDRDIVEEPCTLESMSYVKEIEWKVFHPRTVFM